jgi:hypothetical protein
MYVMHDDQYNIFAAKISALVGTWGIVVTFNMAATAAILKNAFRQFRGEWLHQLILCILEVGRYINLYLKYPFGLPSPRCATFFRPMKVDTCIMVLVSHFQKSDDGFSSSFIFHQLISSPNLWRDFRKNHLYIQDVPQSIMQS